MTHWAEEETYPPTWSSSLPATEPASLADAGFGDYPPKAKHLQQEDEHQMDQLTTYGTLNDADLSPRSSSMYSWDGLPSDTEAATPSASSRSLDTARRQQRIERVKDTQKSLFLLWWPSILSICLTAAVGLGGWSHVALVHVVMTFVAVMALGLLTIAWNGGWPGQASRSFFVVNSVCISFMAVIGLILGSYCFQTYTKTYEIYRNSAFYANLKSGVDPGAYMDAGTVTFEQGTSIAVAKSVGFASGDVYCVAPILGPDSCQHDPDAGPTPCSAGFWAVGTNCCGGDHTFDCAGPQVRTGLVVLDENLFGRAEIPLYTKAAEEASEHFNIAMAPTPIFLRMMPDIDAVREQLHSDALSFMSLATAGIFAFMLVVVATLNSASRNGFEVAEFYYSVEVFDDYTEKTSLTRAWKHRPSHHVDRFLHDC